MENPAGRLAVVKKIIDSEAMLLSIGDVANAVDVSTRQLRYWEKKGYIKSKISKTGQRKYTYFTMIQAGNIASYIEDGFTLAKAAEKAQSNGHIMKALRHFLKERFSGGREIPNGYEFDLGEIKGLPKDQRLFIEVLEDGESFFQVKKESTND
ncbi:MerR family transcriptional regulator [Pediococcus pentosaceus]|uniref:MerR family transcriptional regulator n=1 Tax=Pediococcus pentosaceus TaxID=1255 RepID=UPI00211C47C8|nr:MerR family transcriptional regulator [Pediococcus pentosaceus]MCQ9316561.1 MerR family transcriptional regulator [Pediococcus pentosaceus]MCQ9339051.1 MerR family transcriptional regulator [Pediococcus pentosaceus]